MKRHFRESFGKDDPQLPVILRDMMAEIPGLKTSITDLWESLLFSIGTEQNPVAYADHIIRMASHPSRVKMATCEAYKNGVCFSAKGGEQVWLYKDEAGVQLEVSIEDGSDQPFLMYTALYRYDKSTHILMGLMEQLQIIFRRNAIPV